MVIPWTEETGGLQSMGLQRDRHDSVTRTHTTYGCTCNRYVFNMCDNNIKKGSKAIEVHTSNIPVSHWN